jgi:beta-lactamase regulating signal transducer with metallopeptidase domain
MNRLANWIDAELIYATGWTLVHSLWQYSLIALFVTLSYAFTKKSQANTRYWIATLGLVSCGLVSLVTFYVNLHDKISIVIAESNFVVHSARSQETSYTQSFPSLINTYINQVVLFWLIGFFIYVCKYLADFIYCQKIKQLHTKHPDGQWEMHFSELKNSLGIAGNVQLRISEIINIPCVIGHLKPVVLLPAGLLTGLTQKQIEVILLHELGHVRRSDYLISSLQNIFISIYFFNPFVHWISSKMDEERENACDDIAISVSGDPLFYAHTLKEFAEMKNNNALAVAITGHKNLLLNRITRLFVRDVSFTKTYGKTLTAITLFLLCAGFTVTGYSTEDKSKDDSFTLKLDKEPLSKLLKLTQDFCPNIPKDIKLKHGDQLVSGDFANLRCEHTEAFIKNLDENLSKTFTGITINEDKISLKQLTQKIESACPEFKGKLSLSNPDKVVGFQTDNLNCGGIDAAIQQLDTNPDAKLINIKGAGDISIRTKTHPDVYTNAIPLRIPKESIDKVYLGECTALYSVDEKGKGFDITANCTDGKPEAKAFLEKQITTAIQNAQFPIKTENGKAVTVKGIKFRLRLDPAMPINGEAAASQ